MKAIRLSREVVRALDRRAIQEYGIPSAVLMENAGRACADTALALLPHAPAKPVLCLCGVGNNGGDGLVIARTLANRGVRAEVLVLATPARLGEASADVRVQVELWKGIGGALECLIEPEAVSGLRKRMGETPLIIDALFGTGLNRPLGSPFRELIALVNDVPTPVLAVDLPSGLDADTGEALGAVIHANTTVTFVAEKPGFVIGVGPRVCGDVVVAEIGIPRAWFA